MAKKTEAYKKYFVNMAQNAADDLKEIVDYIAQEHQQAAQKIMERIQAKVKTLDHFPERGGYVPELLAKNIKTYRQLIELPWKIIYRVDGKTVNILAIVDSRRNLQDALIKKLLK
jgi:addiction module RelE/StbE family toxin